MKELWQNLRDLRITKTHILNAINQLPDDATIEDALNTLMIIWRIDKSLQRDKGISQKDVEQHFLNRRKMRENGEGNE